MAEIIDTGPWPGLARQGSEDLYNYDQFVTKSYLANVLSAQFINLEPGLRLSLSSSDPIGDSQSGTTIYYVAYKSNIISLYNTNINEWEVHKIPATISLAISAVADRVNDIFVYYDQATSSYKLEAVAWSTTTARVTALATKDNIYVKTSQNYKRYIGTTWNVSSTVNTLLGGLGVRMWSSDRVRGVYNHYNQIEQKLYVDISQTGALTAYTPVNTIRRAKNGATGTADVWIVTGVAGNYTKIKAMALMDETSSGFDNGIGIGVNTSTSNNADLYSSEYDSNAVESEPVPAVAELIHKPSVGLTYYCQTEGASLGSSATYYYPPKSGLLGTVSL